MTVEKYRFNLTKNVSMYYKKQKIGKKWYPRSFTAGTYDTKDVAERLSEMSTVSKIAPSVPPASSTTSAATAWTISATSSRYPMGSTTGLAMMPRCVHGCF